MITVESFTRELIFGQKLELPDVISDPSEKKDSRKDKRKRKRGPRKKKNHSNDDDDDLEDATESDSLAAASS